MALSISLTINRSEINRLNLVTKVTSDDNSRSFYNDAMKYHTNFYVETSFSPITKNGCNESQKTKSRHSHKSF